MRVTLANFMGFQNIEQNDMGHYVCEKNGTLQFIPDPENNWEDTKELIKHINNAGFTLNVHQCVHNGMCMWSACFLGNNLEYYATGVTISEAICNAAYNLITDKPLKRENTVTTDNLIINTHTGETIIIPAIKKIGPVQKTSYIPGNYMFSIYISGMSMPTTLFFDTFEDAEAIRKEILIKLSNFYNA